LLGDPAAGEDVAHVALMNAYQALRSGRLPERVRPWLYRIAHNAAVDALLRRRELPQADLRAADEQETRDQPAVRGALLDALTALPDRQRRAYVLRELHGLRIAEIGFELSLSVPQVEQALFSARNRLAELLLFGERLSCEAARRLAGGPLDWAERKAVRSHARSCPSCRTALGRRATALGLLPALDWLRGLAAAAGGGGGDVAVAKVGAVAATATLVAGIPAAHDLTFQPRHVSAALVRKTPAHATHSTPRVARMLAVERASGSAPPVRRGEDRRGGSQGRGDSQEARLQPEGDRHERGSGERGRGPGETRGRTGDSIAETSTVPLNGPATVPGTETRTETSTDFGGSSGPPTGTEAQPTSTQTSFDNSGPGSSVLTDGGHDGSGSGGHDLTVLTSEGSGSHDGSGSSGGDSGSSSGELVEGGSSGSGDGSSGHH
jgi:RNA polymerase sigma factor (sigma-70 family)